MSFLDNVKKAGQATGKAVQDKYNEEKAKSEALKNLRGDLLTSLKTEYVGGYGNHKKTKGELLFYRKRLIFKGNLGKNSFEIENQTISDIAIEGRHEVNRRVTVTRLLVLNVFAFAAKKKQEEKEAYITVVLADGQEVVFHIDNKSPLQLKTSLAGTLSSFNQSAKNAQQTAAQINAAPTQAANSADALMKLAELKEKGILTEEEFLQEKKKLLG